MIERLLAAEAALEDGHLDVAERRYRQIAAADPRNAIALVGLARVAHRRGNADSARELAEQALSIDPDEAAATKLLTELTTEPAAGPVPQAPARSSVVNRLRAWIRRLLG